MAATAGVSPSTASKALNGRRGQVSEATQARVRHVAEDLGFTPNALAQAMHTTRTGTVGLITDDLEGRFSLPILMGAEDTFGADRTSVFLCDGRGDPIRESHHLRALVSRQVDGLIVVGARPDTRPSVSHRVPMPVVYAYAASEDDNDHCVTTDNVRAGELVAEHMLALGRRNIAHISGDPAYSAAQERVEGITSVLAEHNLNLTARPLFGSWTETWGRAAARVLMEGDHPVDAIIGGSDRITRGIIETVKAMGYRIPEDIAVASFDNWDPLVSGGQPPVTSVDFRFKEIGRRAARLLSLALDSAVPEGSREVVEPQLVIRESSVGL
ncbi:LacI family DNA-binding transcriptional regulator [Nesterenkonia alba]|uniref:LacI family DNA-binding transcriptional regulator n=1 Tax=Nesterenkonia alba TaxID=515814 RepID=UPI001FE0147A|nr:LacI family DNA-binding transcriptional regulator [Nesterenkonia alba]